MAFSEAQKWKKSARILSLIPVKIYSKTINVNVERIVKIPGTLGNQIK